MNTTKQFLYPNGIQTWMTEHEDMLSLVDTTIADWAKQYGTNHISHYKGVIEHVQRISNSSNITCILDVGAVPGHISAMLKYAGFSVHAVDIDPERAKGVFDSMNIPYYRVNVESEPWPFLNDSFDLILFCEILEHLRNQPLKAIQEIYRVLKPGGSLLLSTPHITPLMRWRFLWNEDFQDDLVSEFAKIESIGHMGHFRLFSQNEINRILTSFGFSIIQADTGGKLHSHDKRWDARLLRKLVPNQMRSQLYVWARK